MAEPREKIVAEPMEGTAAGPMEGTAAGPVEGTVAGPIEGIAAGPMEIVSGMREGIAVGSDLQHQHHPAMEMCLFSFPFDCSPTPETFVLETVQRLM